MFGIANQLLACVALCVATTIILREGAKKAYALITLLPLAFWMWWRIGHGNQCGLRQPGAGDRPRRSARRRDGDRPQRRDARS